MAPAPVPPPGDMPRVATFSRPLNSVEGGSDGTGNTPGSKPAAAGEGGSFTSSMEGTFHQVRKAKAAHCLLMAHRQTSACRPAARRRPLCRWRAPARLLAAVCAACGVRRAASGAAQALTRLHALRRRPRCAVQDPQAMRMHRIAELLFYCSVGNLKAVKKLVRLALGVACAGRPQAPEKAGADARSRCGALVRRRLRRRRST